MASQRGGIGKVLQNISAFRTGKPLELVYRKPEIIRITAMRMRSDDFLGWENKAITLLGMSGVGKSTLAVKLRKFGWFHYSVDYRIGTRYLEEPILDNIKRKAMQVGFLRELLRNGSIYIGSNITAHNLEPVSTFLGKVGDSTLGGLPVNEFKIRQRLHREAEILAMQDVREFIEKSHELFGYAHFVNDAGGSLCELDDPQTLADLAKYTLILYIRGEKVTEQELIRRNEENPKPIYYQEAFFDRELNNYLAINNLTDSSKIIPDEFVRWIFPRLIEHRKPRYEQIANDYGYTIAAVDVEKISNEEDFLSLVAATLEGTQEAVA